MTHQTYVFLMTVAFAVNMATGVQAADPSTPPSPYMGGLVELVKAPNGAITNKKLLDRVGDFNWLKSTIENPAEGIWVFGGYGLASMSVIEAQYGLIAFDTGDTKHDGELMFQAIRTVSKKPIKAIIYGHSHTVAGAGVLAEGNKNFMLRLSEPEQSGQSDKEKNYEKFTLYEANHTHNPHVGHCQPYPAGLRPGRFTLS